MVWWREVDWRANAFYCATAVPCAALGARTLLLLDPRIVEGILGLLFLLMIPMRRWLFARGLRIEAWHLSLIGAGIGFLSGMVASTGPINTPFFLAYGLVKGAYLSTEALGSMAIGITKAIVFQRFDALPLETVARGLVVGASLMAGSRSDPRPRNSSRCSFRNRASSSSTRPLSSSRPARSLLAIAGAYSDGSRASVRSYRA